MSILKIKKRDNFTVLDNQFLQNQNLTFRAKGLLAYLMSLPSNWEVRVDVLVKDFPEGKHVFYSVLKELKQFGYVVSEWKRGEGGAFKGITYLVSDTPALISDKSHQSKSEPSSNNQEAVLNQPFPDFPDTDKRDTENQETIKNIYRKKERNKKRNTAAEEIAEMREVEINAAAVESIISENKLSLNQQSFVRETLQKEFSANDRQVAEVVWSLENPKSFTNAGNDFLKKLNTIKKLIVHRKWIAPVGYELELESTTAISRNISSKKQTISNRLRELETLLISEQRAMQTSPLSTCSEFTASCQKQISRYQQEIDTLKARTVNVVQLTT